MSGTWEHARRLSEVRWRGGHCISVVSPFPYVCAQLQVAGAGGEDDEVGLDDLAAHELGLGPARVGEVGDAIRGEVRGIGGDVDGALGGRHLGVEEELADACGQGECLGTVGVGHLVLDALPRLVDKHFYKQQYKGQFELMENRMEVKGRGLGEVGHLHREAWKRSP